MVNGIKSVQAFCLGYDLSSTNMKTKRERERERELSINTYSTFTWKKHYSSLVYSWMSLKKTTEFVEKAKITI